MTNPYFKYYVNKNIKESTILYESFFAESIACGPYALFSHLINNTERYGEFVHVWVVKDIEKSKVLLQDKMGENQIIFVEYKSKEYHEYLATSKYIINNMTFPQYFRKREGQIYINTWHGIPLKKMGYEMPKGRIEAANTARNFLQADYLLSPNTHHTKMYNDVYMMKNVFEGVILQEGQARVDTIMKTNPDVIIEKLIQQGIKIDKSKKIIMYAPTWRGTTFGKSSIGVKKYIEFYEYVSKKIDSSKYQLLIKPHISVYQEIKNGSGEYGECIVPPTIGANEVLSAVDILISDYSSIFYDFLATDRPVLFYCDDLEEYQKYRGMENVDENLPGPMTGSVEQLVEWLNDVDNEYQKNLEKYNRIKAWACPKDDGNVCARVLDIILKDKEYKNYAVKEDKEKLLIFLGSLQTSGITFSLLSLLNKMDYSKYDITLYVYEPNQEDGIKRLEGIPKEVRVFVHTVSAFGGISDSVHFSQWLISNKANKTVERIANQEFIRMFGQAKFDYVVDFVGYSPLFALVAGYAKYGVKSIWQHNDMAADRLRKVKGKYPNKKKLDIVFELYNQFDNVVSCSKSVMKVNMDKIGRAKNYEYVRNMIDVPRIELGMSADSHPSVDTSKVNYINMGRLSTEKNHMTLLKAFSRLIKEYPDSRLYILGDGILREELKSYIEQNNLAEYVTLTGNVSNPFSYMKACDCFVLPSLHEGQPMVILEARMLGLPMVLSRFSTIDDCLIDNGQLVIGNSEEDIYNGLKEYRKGNVPTYEFDAQKYNDQAMKGFLQAIRKA